MRIFLKSIFLFTVIGFCTTALAEKININTATASVLARTMKGVGKKKARAIVRYRKRHGPFSRLDHLTRVKGIGKKTLSKNRNKLTLIGLDRTGSGTASKGRARRKKKSSTYTIILGK
jgi:competence protein ComEA